MSLDQTANPPFCDPVCPHRVGKIGPCAACPWRQRINDRSDIVILEK